MANDVTWAAMLGPVGQGDARAGGDCDFFPFRENLVLGESTPEALCESQGNRGRTVGRNDDKLFATVARPDRCFAPNRSIAARRRGGLRHRLNGHMCR